MYRECGREYSTQRATAALRDHSGCDLTQTGILGFEVQRRLAAAFSPCTTDATS